jgi:PucR C-terminal helix-turn-helix domain/GGDEF-like domain
MFKRPGVPPLTLAELCRVEPLTSARTAHLADPTRHVDHVVLAESFERLRRCPPHAAVVLHAGAATGRWSLAAALHRAWERNVAALVVPAAVASPSNTLLAERLKMSLLIVHSDPIDVALKLASQVSNPDTARALRRATCAERLSEQHTVRGVLTLLNAELDPIPVALLVGKTVAAGRAAAVADRAGLRHVSVEVAAPGQQPWSRLVAAVADDAPAETEQVTAVLRLARPALLAAWMQTRLDASTHAEHEQAAFALLRRRCSEPSPEVPPDPQETEAPPWSLQFGWHVDQINRAVWLMLSSTPDPPPEMTHLVRAAWQRGHPRWPLIAEQDGWISWQSSATPNDAAPMKRALTAFRESALTHGLVVGVGCARPGVAGLMHSVAEARVAAHVAREQGPGTIQWFEDVGTAAALAFLPITEIAEVAELSLPELTEARDRAALVDTVLAVLDCGGSLSSASQRLNVHRNTVLSRLTRARSLGLAFDDPRQRLALHVLCYALAASRAHDGH